MDSSEVSEGARRKRPPSPLPREGRTHTKRRAHSFEFRVRVVKLYLEEGYGAKEIAQSVGISTQTLYAWAKRYRECGEEGLHVGGRTGTKKPKERRLKKEIVDQKKKHPGFGIKRIAQALRRFCFLEVSAETVRQTLHEEELIEAPKRKPKRNPSKPRFFERAKPNQLWQSDIFTFRLGGRNAYVIGFLDDHSRYVTGLGLFRSQTAEHVLEVYRTAVAEFGVPKEMLTDNGRQYTNWRGTTRFEAELKKDRVKHLKSRPQHPMTLGKIERFWKSIWTEFLSRAQFESFESARERVQLWVKYYNHRRVHQGIGGSCPADRFFGVDSDLRQVLEQGIQDNLQELALRGEPRKPFYLVGRMNDQSVVMRAEKGKLVMSVNDEEQHREQELVYDLQKGELDAQDLDDEEETRPTPTQCGGEVPGGTVALDGEPDDFGNLPGAVGLLDDPGSVAAEGPGGDAGGPEAEGPDPGADPGLESETPEAAGEEGGGQRPRDAIDLEHTPTHATPPDATRTTIHARDITDDEEVRERSPALDRFLRVETRDGSTGIEARRPDPEGAERADDRAGGGRRTGSVPEDLLRMGGPRSGSDVDGPPRPADRSPEDTPGPREGSPERPDRPTPERTGRDATGDESEGTDARRAGGVHQSRHPDGNAWRPR